MSTNIIEITNWLAKQEGISTTKLEGKIKKKTDDAVLLKNDEEERWIPKSQIKKRNLKPPQYKPIKKITPDDTEVRVFVTVTDVEEQKLRVKDDSGEISLVYEESPPEWISSGTEIEAWGTPLVLQSSREIYVHKTRKIS